MLLIRLLIGKLLLLRIMSLTLYLQLIGGYLQYPALKNRNASFRIFGFGRSIVTQENSPKIPSLLHVRNAHENDAKIAFFEKDHYYTFDGYRMKWSVTSLIQKYFHEFDATTAVRNMMTSKNWPRKEYCHPSGQPFTPEEIIKSWSVIGEVARLQGTAMHQNIERICNGLDPIAPMPELHQFLEFYNGFMKKSDIIPYRTEWHIASRDLSIAGSVDFVGVNAQKEIFIVDWKRTKRLSTQYKHGFKPYFAKSPIDHIPNSDLSKYMLQLNMYSFILEQYYNIKTKKMFLVSLHPSLKKPFLFDVPILRSDIELIIKDIQCRSDIS